MAVFEQARADQDIRLSVLPSRSSKLNGHVERVNYTFLALLLIYRAPQKVRY
jgi:hypothetical protein